MAICFVLFKHDSDEPTPLQQVDDEMREHFGAPPSATDWYEHWYQTIGFWLAEGASRETVFERCKEYEGSPLLAIAEWLFQSYEPYNWAGR